MDLQLVKEKITVWQETCQLIQVMGKFNWQFKISIKIKISRTIIIIKIINNNKIKQWINNFSIHLIKMI